MKRLKLTKYVLVGLVVGLVSLNYSCTTDKRTSRPTLPPTSTIRSTPSEVSHTQIPSITLTLTPTELPTITPTIVHTDTPVILPLSSEGPWFVVATSKAIWAVNADGSGARMLYEFRNFPNYGISVAVAPFGGLLAFAETAHPVGPGSPTIDPVSDPGMNLFFIQLPDPSPQVVTALVEPNQLVAIATEFPEEAWPIEDSAWFHREQIKAAVSRPRSMAWSSDGSSLAFSAAMDGPTSDLYILDVQSGRIARLTSGSTQTADIEWSPNDRYIVHKAVSDINIGRSGPILITEGVWAAAADGSRINLLASGQGKTLGWLSSSEIMVASWNMPCDLYDLRSVNISTRESSMIWRGAFDAAASDSVTGTVLVGTSYEEQVDDPLCPTPKPQGLYKISPPHVSVERISDFQWTGTGFYPSIEWSNDWGKFFVTAGGDAFSVDPLGEISERGSLSSLFLLMAPSGLSWAETGARSIRIVTEGQEDKFINGFFCNKLWRPDSEALLLSNDESVFLADAPTYSPIQIITGLYDLCVSTLQWVTP